MTTRSRSSSRSRSRSSTLYTCPSRRRRCKSKASRLSNHSLLSRENPHNSRHRLTLRSGLCQPAASWTVLKCSRIYRLPRTTSKAFRLASHSKRRVLWATSRWRPSRHWTITWSKNWEWVDSVHRAKTFSCWPNKYQRWWTALESSGARKPTTLQVETYSFHSSPRCSKCNLNRRLAWLPRSWSKDCSSDILYH